MRIVMLGPPGAGKGTQAARLARHFGIAHLSTGDILRAAVAEGSELGRKAEGYVNSGDLVPSELLTDLLRERLYEERQFLLDGFPRTIEQAEFLEEMEDLPLDRVLYIDVDEDTLVKRLTGRRVCKVCGKIYNVYNSPSVATARCGLCGGELVQREDDNEETVRRRLQVYKLKTDPLREFYRARGLLTELDGKGTVDEVYAKAAEVLGRYGRGAGRDNC